MYLINYPEFWNEKKQNKINILDLDWKLSGKIQQQGNERIFSSKWIQKECVPPPQVEWSSNTFSSIKNLFNFSLV